MHYAEIHNSIESTNMGPYRIISLTTNRIGGGMVSVLDLSPAEFKSKTNIGIYFFSACIIKE
jgi:hypothetical protein